MFKSFAAQYFGDSGRNTLVVFGAGFDPRAREIPALLAQSGPAIDAWILREDRPAPHAANKRRADEATAALRALFRNSHVVQFPVFEADGALAVPGSLMNSAPMEDLKKYDDVVLDFSALSLGVSYPLAKLLYDRGVVSRRNLHLAVTAAPEVDDSIRASYDDRVQSPRGFYRPAASEVAAAVMWVPQLHSGLSTVLERVGQSFDRDSDICPIVPFPTRTIRRPEELFIEYQDLLNNVWRVDSRDVIYAAENDPLDIYRVLVRIARERKEVFEAVGASEIVLTPMGSKVVALGALMAALEENLSVSYVEARDYEPYFPTTSEYEMMSVWLLGGPEWEASQ